MPLHDHFRPPLSIWRPWEGFHGAWAAALAFHLNSGLLPSEYYAMPLLEVTGRVEVDVATFQAKLSEDGGVAVWTAPRPALVVPVEAVDADTFEVRVMRNFGGPQLRAAIELVSPSNKDRASSRKVFAAKCADYLRRGVSVVVIDVVTERLANLHAEILREFDRAGEPVWESPSHLYAVAYRGARTNGEAKIEVWPEALKLGATLPTLPLWLEKDLSVPLKLEESYAVTCGSLRLGE